MKTKIITLDNQKYLYIVEVESVTHSIWSKNEDAEKIKNVLINNCKLDWVNIRRIPLNDKQCIEIGNTIEMSLKGEIIQKNTQIMTRWGECRIGEINVYNWNYNRTDPTTVKKNKQIWQVRTINKSNNVVWNDCLIWSAHETEEKAINQAQQFRLQEIQHLNNLQMPQCKICQSNVCKEWDNPNTIAKKDSTFAMDTIWLCSQKCFNINRSKKN